MVQTQERETGTRLVDQIRVVDVDCHIVETPDIWTSRLSEAKWGDKIPHVAPHPETGKPVWMMNNQPTVPVAYGAMAGWKEWGTRHPPTLEEADPAAWDPDKRLERMDEYGIYTEILYPNVAGFGNAEFLKLGDPQLMRECTLAWNDFQTEWCSVDPKRLIPITAAPFWDLDFTVEEIRRCAAMGHKGVLLTGSPERYGQVHLGHPDWTKVFNTCEELGLPINFHLGGGGSPLSENQYEGNGYATNGAQSSVKGFLSNAKQIAEVIASGICHRHPTLKIVSVEAGIGWLPFLLEAYDWQWGNNGVFQEHPDWGLSPSEYFKRQIYAPFWFEKRAALAAIEYLGPDNFMYETDFPHPTSMSPGPASIAQTPSEYIEEFFTQLPEDSARKILRDNAVRVYNLDVD